MLLQEANSTIHWGGGSSALESAWCCWDKQSLKYSIRYAHLHIQHVLMCRGAAQGRIEMNEEARQELSVFFACELSCGVCSCLGFTHKHACVYKASNKKSFVHSLYVDISTNNGLLRFQRIDGSACESLVSSFQSNSSFPLFVYEWGLRLPMFVCVLPTDEIASPPPPPPHVISLPLGPRQTHQTGRK